MALNQDQPIGDDRFYREIEAMTGQKRELRKRGRPRKPREGKGVRLKTLATRGRNTLATGGRVTEE